MSTGSPDGQLLESIWHDRIPMAASMQLSVVDYTAEQLMTRAPLEPNVNLHGTAFAGSLYSICALTGWGYVWRLGRQNGFCGDIVLIRGEIEYLRPVAEAIVCRARASEEAGNAFVAALRDGRAGRCHVDCLIDARGKPAARFSGNYHMRVSDCTPAGG